MSPEVVIFFELFMHTKVLQQFRIAMFPLTSKTEEFNHCQNLESSVVIESSFSVQDFLARFCGFAYCQHWVIGPKLRFSDNASTSKTSLQHTLRCIFFVMRPLRWFWRHAFVLQITIDVISIYQVSWGDRLSFSIFAARDMVWQAEWTL